ncbi:hypothetical protein F4802DRAFT_611032 [Xylaria palmicola]|nr:hypothetical protein F4802DRAFT_611032 [Xylaria palmicola]
MSQVTAPVSPARSKWEQAIQRLSEQDRAQLHNVNISPDERRLVLNAVLDTANNRIEECRSKRWKVVVGNHPIYIRDVLEKFSVWVKKLIVIGDIAIQYDPVHAALPWAAMRFIMQTSINDIEAFGEIMVSLENLASIVSQCHVIEAVYLDERKHKTTELSNHITESYLVETIKYLDLGTGKRLLRRKYSPITHALESFGRIAGIAQSSELKHGVDLIEKIEKQLKDRDARDESELGWLKTTMKQLQQPIDRIDTRLGEIEDGLRREIRAKILSATSTIPHGNHHKIHSKDRIKGSGRWFLQRPEFKQWRRSSSPSALWLHGIPGSDELLGHEHVAYFYCKKNPAEPERAQCDKILGSILPILDPVLKCYEDAIEGTGKFEDQSWDTDECVQVLLQLFDEYPGVTLSRQELLDTLSDLIQKSTSLIRIFISSRSNYDISLHLAGTPNIYIQADDNAEDISSFIDKKLAEARLLYGKLSPTLRSTIIDTLESGANGMFRWVDLQIQALRPLKLPADITIRLGSLPGTLEELYWEVFQQIRDFGETASRLATFTFQWLLYAKAPMILGGFASLASIALSADPDTDTKFTAAETYLQIYA